MVILKNSKQEKIEDKWNYYQIADIISPRKIIISNYFKKLYFIKESKRPKYELWTSKKKKRNYILILHTKWHIIQRHGPRNLKIYMCI